jgi:ADP-ribosylglycohydrolase
MTDPLSLTDRARGCLLGGAVGDALGAAIEFYSLARIRESFGPEGVRDMVPAYGIRGAITDDTQMTLFTAEGLLRARSALAVDEIVAPSDQIRRAYLRWLFTQGHLPERLPPGIERAELLDGWLLEQRFLHARRAPGQTCLTSLADPSPRPWAENWSKGCGGVMRMAPAGLASAEGTIRDAYTVGFQAAHLTHGHPTGYLAAGAFAVMIERLAEGSPLDEAIGSGLGALDREEGAETIRGIEAAQRAARELPASPEAVETLGGGWIAEEALSIAVYCALVSHDYESAVLLAVNHSGDTDSTGAITGNLMGALLGPDAIPERWLDELEGREVIDRVASDLVADEVDLERYPPS